MEELFQIQNAIIEQFEKKPFYLRPQFNVLANPRPITGIIGNKGVGKTTFLVKQAIDAGAKKRKALYMSADNTFFLKNKLLDVMDYLYKQTDIRFVCIDEIHKYPNWRMELKNISDTYPSIRIYFAGNSRIDVTRGKYDLSRRVILYKLSSFSLKKYLE